MSGDWPSAAGGLVALAIFVLYRRLSVILERLSKITEHSVDQGVASEASPGDLAREDFWSAIRDEDEYRRYLPTTKRYAWTFRQRVGALLGAIALAVATYWIAYNVGDWFAILGSSRNQSVYRDNWWANWHTHAPLALVWIVVAAVTIYLGMDNFLTSSFVTRDLRELFGDDRVRDQLPFVANTPSRSSIWQHLHSLLGEMQYGAFTALGSATIASILIIHPESNTSVAVVALADLAFIIGLTARFVILKQTLENACAAIMDGEIQECEQRRKAAVEAANYGAAEYWAAMCERVFRHGPLPVLAARQVAVRLIVVATGSLSLIATIAQTLS